MKLSYSVEEAAASTGLSRAYISAAIKEGRLPARTTTQREAHKARGGKRLILAADLEAFVQGLPLESA